MAKPDTYLFGDNSDLELLGNKPVKVKYFYKILDNHEVCADCDFLNQALCYILLYSDKILKLSIPKIVKNLFCTKR